jgi:hypothetical protein
MYFILQVNFDAKRFIEYSMKADDYVQAISSKLQAAGVKERPVAANLPWFDLHGSPINFSLKKTLKDINEESLAKLGEEVGAVCSCLTASAAGAWHLWNVILSPAFTQE